MRSLACFSVLCKVAARFFNTRSAFFALVWRVGGVSRKDSGIKGVKSGKNSASDEIKAEKVVVDGYQDAT